MQRKRNVAMAWVDNKKAYDMVPLSWIKECLNMFGIADNIKELLINSMDTWRTELSCGENIGEVRIRRGLDSLVQTVHVFSSDIGMEFGVKKCAMLVIRRGRLVRSEEIVLPDENKIWVIGENDSHKYLGVLEADKIKREEMKEKLTVKLRGYEKYYS